MTRVRVLFAVLLVLLALPSTAGATVVYATGDGIFVADDGGNVRQLDDDGERPSISADGRYVAWTQHERVRIAAVDGSMPRRTLPNRFALLVDRPAWTARDEVLVFEGYTLTQVPLVAIDAATGARRQLATGDLAFSASASPDGSQLAVERAETFGVRSPERRTIAVLGAGGAKTVAHGTRPVWGPPGIAYVVPRGSRYGDLRIITPTGQPLYRLRRSKAVVWPVAWLDDGRLLAAAAREYRPGGTRGTSALLVDPAARTVTPLGTYSGVYGIKSDGSALLATSLNGFDESAVVVSLADGRRTVLVDGTVDGLAWSTR
jgi:hypothetical protein